MGATVNQTPAAPESGKFNKSLIFGAAGMLCGALLNFLRAVSWLELAPGFTEAPFMDTFNEIIFVGYLVGAGFGLLGLGMYYGKNVFTGLGVVSLLLVADLYFMGIVSALNEVVASSIGYILSNAGFPEVFIVALFSTILYVGLKIAEIVSIALLFREKTPKTLFLGTGGALFLFMILSWVLGGLLHLDVARYLLAMLSTLVMAGFYGFTIYTSKQGGAGPTVEAPAAAPMPQGGGYPPQGGGYPPQG